MKTDYRTVALSALWVACLSNGTGLSVATAGEPVRYNRDVRPILAEACFRCHGPDAAARQAEMRLDDRADATTRRGDVRVIDPGQPAASELIRRVTSLDVDERMPPADAGPPLPAADIDVIRRWIREGAEYEAHWSFVPPRRPSPPAVANENWPRNPIDRFVLSRLEREKLAPSPEADRATLLRRVTLDLTGLPPTVSAIDAWHRHSSDEWLVAYAERVDRLLASPRFGERFALSWLDAARYADTNGYFTDNDRTMWPWRDWVIDAFNRNMPFDQFTVEQLAGDLLPDPSLDQRIATGFNRNHMVNNESGIIEEEFRVEYVADRVDTTATVWMGLTLGCARCHDHKYDPISQQDFYRFFAFFNNVPEAGLSGSRGNSPPVLQVASDQQQRRLKALQDDVHVAEQEFAKFEQELDAAQSAWEMTALADVPEATTDGLVAHYELDEIRLPASIIGEVHQADGMIGGAAELDGDACISIADGAEFERDDPFSVAAWIHPSTSAGCVISKIDDAHDMRGFDLSLRKGKAVVNLVHRWNRDAIQVSTASSLSTRQWQHLLVTYDGSGKAAGVTIYRDGQRQPVNVGHDSLTGTMQNSEPLRIGRRQASASYQGRIDEVRIYHRELSEGEVQRLASGQMVRGIVSQAPQKRSKTQQRKLRDWFIQQHASQAVVAASNHLARTRSELNGFQKTIPTTMVMQESDEPRPAFLLVRGEYDQHGPEVTAGVPAFLADSSPFDARRQPDERNAPGANRLEMARWLVHSKHPLTARVAVNRLWQQFFGTGIVKTVDDFGTQGDWPSHPDLLDWLAVELVESGWDLEHIVRLIVESATYRQSAACSPEILLRDRENRWLARGPRFRMDAEMLRDNALAISGLLVETIGGPSVKPYQPAGLWQDVTYDGDLAYQQDAGAALYRRSLYTFWKRQSPPPGMTVFDAPTRETCTLERPRTNTPLQALALMNDPTFVEASRKLAERAMTGPREGAAERVNFLFGAATARRPTNAEANVLIETYRHQSEHFQEHQQEAVHLISVGDSPRDESLDAAELAAWTTVASMVLCLDETISRP